MVTENWFCHMLYVLYEGIRVLQSTAGLSHLVSTRRQCKLYATSLPINVP